MIKYKIIKTNQFKKQYKKVKKQKYFNEKDFIDVVNILVRGETLPAKYQNHLLEPKTKRVLWMSHKTRLASHLYDQSKYVNFNAD